jgi:hypothetical protein
LSNLATRLSEKDSEIERLKEENKNLRDRISKLEIPDFIPKEQKIQEWLKGREIEYERERINMENSKILASGDVAVRLGEVLKDNKYAPHAINSVLKKTLVAAGEEVKSAVNTVLEDRISSAYQLGFTWQTRSSKRPSREATCVKLLSKWEAEYQIGKEYNINFLPDPSAIAESGDGAVCAVINMIVEALGGELDLGIGKNNFNRLQKAIRIYKSSPVKVLSPAQPVGDTPVELCNKVFGPGLPEEEKVKVIATFAERLSRYKSASEIPPELIRKSCTLSRLPVFFTWDQAHKDAHSRLKALKNGHYDHEYKRLLETLVVESKTEG